MRDDVKTSGVIAGQVIEVACSLDANWIRRAQVAVGHAKQQIVFGGPDIVIPGDFVAVAPPGSRVPGSPKKMRRRTYRGMSSWGMLCSTTELGWEQNGDDEVALLRPQCVTPGFSLDSIEWREYVLPLSGWRLQRRRAWDELKRSVEQAILEPAEMPMPALAGQAP